MMKSISIAFCVGLLAFGAQSNAVRASLPVGFTVTGCVTGAKLVSEQFTYRVFDKDRQEMGLALYEGKTIRIRGFITPGDYLFVEYLTVVDDKCRPELHSREIIRED